MVIPAVPHLLQQLGVELAGVGGGGEGLRVEAWHSYGFLAASGSRRQGNDGQEEDNQRCPLNPGKTPPEGKTQV